MTEIPPNIILLKEDILQKSVSKVGKFPKNPIGIFYSRLRSLQKSESKLGSRLLHPKCAPNVYKNFGCKH